MGAQSLMAVAAVAVLGLAVVPRVEARVSAADRRVDPELRRLARSAPASMIKAVVQLPSGDSATLAALGGRGVEFSRDRHGAPRHLGAYYPVRATASLLRTLAAEGLHVSLGRAGAEEPTLSTGTEMEAWAVAAYGPAPLDGPTGRDVTIADIDNAIDLFHPHFFRADGGAYPWVDLDADGQLTPGVDGIDTNVDGEIEDHEILRLMDYAHRYTGAGGTQYEGLDGVFNPALDYLFVDFNGDGQRNYGATAGYSEGSPGYGEAMFLPDDANGDGMIDVDERVLLLGTSKIAAFHRGGTTWRRGDNLIFAPQNEYSVSSHGTSVVGILVGGQDRLFRVHRGLLADAELILLSRWGNSGEADLIDSIAWATQEEGVEVVLHEYARWYGVHLDGSRVLDEAIDASVDDGVVHVCPAGNLQGSGKHAYVESDGPLTVALTVPDDNHETYQLDLHWPADVTLECTLNDPAGGALILVEDSMQILGEVTVISNRWDSPAGTALLSMNVIGNAALTGDWSIDCTHDAPTVGLHAYLDDPQTSWGRGVFFQQEDPTSTMCSPSTADRCLAVGAYLWQHAAAYGERAGALAPYSGLGPRIDGGKTIDIAAPADPFAPYPSVEDPALGFEDVFFQNNYAAFGGTSGAGPHVAAAAALLLEGRGVDSGEEINDRIFEGAAVDPQVRTDPDAWGQGRLRAYGALYGEPAPERPDYVARELSVEFIPNDGECIARVSVDGMDWPSPTARWDDDYDGTWDTEFIEGDARELVLAESMPGIIVRAEFGREGWRVGGAVLTAEAPAECFEPLPDTTGTETGVAESTGDLPGGTAADDTTGGSSTGSDGGQQVEEGGCGCTTTSPRGGSLGAGLLLLGLWRVRRRRARR